MARHEASFKLEVVKDYQIGGKGYRALAQHYGLDHGTVRRWIQRYQQHGIAGLRKKYSHYSAVFKRAALQRMWSEELSYREASALFDLRDPGAISRWERQYHAGTLDVPAEPKMPTKPPEPAVPQSDETRTREQLLDEVKNLRAEVAYLKKLDALIQAKKLAAQKKRG